MDTAQASQAWEMSEKEVFDICTDMGIDPENIPDDTVPVYHPDSFYADNPHRFYIYLLEVIANTHMDIKGVDKTILETCVAQLKEKKLIVQKVGADPDSLDYHDYIISSENVLYNEWTNSLVKESVSFLDKILSIFKKSEKE